MFRAEGKQQKVLATLVLVTAMLITTACGKKKSTATTSTVNAAVPTIPPSPTLPNVSLFDGSGTATPIGSGSQPPTSGQLVQPNPNLNNMTPWNYFNQYLPNSAGPNDVRAIATVGETYRMGFQLVGDAQAQYQIVLPSSVQPVTGNGCPQPVLAGPVNGSVSLCIRFTQPTVNGNISPIQLMVQGYSPSAGAINVTRNIWVIVLPGQQQSNYQFMVVNSPAGFGAIPPVANRLTNIKNNFSREVIPARFTVALTQNGQPVSLQNAQYSLEPASSGRVLGAFGGQINLEVGVGGRVTVVAAGLNQYGQQITARGELQVPKQVSVRYTRRNDDCTDDDDRAVLVCSNLGATPYVLSVNGVSGFGGAQATVAPGALSQKVSDMAVVKENGKWIGLYTISVEGSQTAGSVVCEALILDQRGREQQRFAVPGL